MESRFGPLHGEVGFTIDNLSFQRSELLHKCHMESDNLSVPLEEANVLLLPNPRKDLCYNLVSPLQNFAVKTFQL